ncbi:acyltransferase family protein [Sphingomonas abietis]|uniref:Acyltransferase family protein n=1 Tax=Sphingomonas abietis TaxID=3012344 RepID=A0ABY7NH11_9SPHN|nr:acyltransferase family protein [Sphingomonas abietis]WBO20832.1 acyltransferase family protein [Sphingomonas abietis]
MDRAEQRLPVVDGLRAFAVVAVVLFHGFPALVGGGYIGVDIFFVISGFVIALRYLEPMIAREVGYGHFFLRRVRRLVPAYFAMLIATTIAAACVMVPKDLINFATSLIGQALYLQNIVFWVQGEYFDAALLKPLLHTWSLAIEEQFYLCFPLLVLALRRCPRGTIVACVILSLLALGVGAYVEQISPKTTFYWLPFRVWEFFAGIGAAMLFRRGVADRLTPPAATVIGFLALAGILAAALLFDSDDASVLTQGLLAVVATAALCLVQQRLAPGLRTLFTNPIAQHFGRISYSWYLWHWPPLVLAYLLLGHAATGGIAVALTLLGYGLGVASWRLFERGASRAAWLAPPSRTIALLLVFLLSAAAAGAALIASNGFLQRYPANERPLLLAEMDRPDGRCTFTSRLEHWRGQTCRVNAVGGRGGILFIGDSHVEMQKHALAALGDRYGVPVFITKQNCRVVDFGVDRNCHWPVWRGVARDIRREKISRVVVIALWPEPFDPAAFDAAVSRILATGAKVVLERPTPRDERLAPAFYLGHPADWGDQSLYPAAMNEARQRPVNAAMTGWAARDSRVSLLDPAPSLCPGERCLFAQGGVPLYSDTHHLTSAGVRLIAPIYDPLFAAAARERAAAPGK